MPTDTPGFVLREQRILSAAATVHVCSAATSPRYPIAGPLQVIATPAVWVNLSEQIKPITSAPVVSHAVRFTKHETIRYCEAGQRKHVAETVAET